MEVFLWIIFGPLIVALILGVPMYLADPKGWKGTLKRVSTTTRSVVEHKKGVPVQALTSGVSDQDAWQAQFEGRELTTPELNHELVKTDYYRTTDGKFWPQWHCKCGHTGRKPSGIWDDKETKKQAMGDAKEHIDSLNESEKKLRETNGKFAW